MSIAFTCPCGKPLRAAAEYAGRGVKCPNCGKTLTIPSRSGDPVRVAAARSDSRPAAPAPADGYIRFNCACGKAMQAKAQYAGRLARCPGCGDNVFIPKDGADDRIRAGKPSSLASRTPLPPKKAPPPADDFDEEPDFDEVDEVDEAEDLEEAPEERPSRRKAPKARADEDDDRPRPKKKPTKKKGKKGSGGLWLVLGLAAVLLLLLAGGGGVFWWWVTSEGPPLGDDLTLVPGDAQMFFTARMAEAMSHPVLKQRYDQLAPAQKVMLANAEILFGLPATEMERVTLVAPDAKGELGWLIVTASKPYDRAGLLKKLGNDARRVRYEGRSYYVTPGGVDAVCFSGTRTFVVGREVGVKRCLEVANGKKSPGPLDATVAGAAEHLAVISAVPPPDDIQQFRATMANNPMMAKDVQPILETQRVTATADVAGNQATVEVSFTFPDEARAQQAVGTLAKSVQGLKSMTAFMGAAGGNQPKELREGMAGLNALLDQLKPVGNGSEVVLKARFDLSLLETLSAMLPSGAGRRPGPAVAPAGANPPARGGKSGRGRAG